MTSRLGLGIAGLLLLALPALAQQRPPAPPPERIAQPGRPGWTVDARSGCWLWNASPDPGETVSWTGACPRGPAEGEGSAVWTVHLQDQSRTSTSTGPFRAGRLNGHAVSAWSNGDRFEGEYRDGTRTGRGVYIAADGNRFEGEWRNGRLTGRSLAILANGNRYEGEWRDDRPDGTGTALIDGATYAGKWLEGCFRDAQGRTAAWNRPLNECR